MDDADLSGLDVHGATLGLVGYGAIGRAVAARAAGFGLTVVAHDPQPGNHAGVRFCRLDELLRESDIVSLHVPLTVETEGMIGERELRLMKPTSTLINTSRGAIIDQPALVRALREGWIHSAGLDVQQREPNPDPNDPLLTLPNVVVLPHVGSATLAARSSMVDLAVDNVLRFVEGGLVLTPVRESQQVLEGQSSSDASVAAPRSVRPTASGHGNGRPPVDCQPRDPGGHPTYVSLPMPTLPGQRRTSQLWAGKKG